MSVALATSSHDELTELGEQIAELSTHIDAATYRLLLMIRRFDIELGWHPREFASCAHWLAWRCGLHLGAAREKVRVARALETLPAISEAMRLGEVSYSKARAMTRVATPESEELLLQQARKMTASQLEYLVRHWRVVTGDEEDQEARRQDAFRSFSMSPDENGMVLIKGKLTREQAALLSKALELAEDHLYQQNPEASDPHSLQFVEKPQRSADALALVAERAIDTASKGRSDDRFQIMVHVDESALADPAADGQSLIEGTGRVSAETSRRLACDGNKVTMIHDSDGKVLDVGRKTRIVPTPLQRAVLFRDRHCQFPGCQNRFCDYHHVQHWANGGETNLDNLLLLCRRHHRTVHEGGYRIENDSDGKGPRFLSPSGRWVEVPKRRGDVSAETLPRDNEKLGLTIDRTTGGALSTGERCDMAWVVSVLAHNYGLEPTEGGSDPVADS